MLIDLNREKKRNLTNECIKNQVNDKRRSIVVTVTIDNAPVDYVKEYVYIGQLVSVANAMDKVIKRRVALAWGKFHSLSTIPKTKV